MKTAPLTKVMIFLSALMLVACGAETNDAASEALAAAEAKLAQIPNYDAELAAVSTLREVWDSAETDRLDAITHGDFKRTAPDFSASSVDELKAFIQQVHTTYPDFSITNDGMAAGEDGIFMQWTVTGTDSGRGEESTGNSMRVTGISRYQFADGKIVSELVIFDTGLALTQLDTAELPHTDD